VHPRRKAIVGERLANLALHDTYGMAHIAAHTPIALSAQQAGQTVRITFNAPLKGNTAQGFRLVTDKGEEIKLPASVSGKTVQLHYPGREKITTVLYGWAPYSDGDLLSGGGVPVSTFRLPVALGLQVK
jgi:sialate O-acetylesterase